MGKVIPVFLLRCALADIMISGSFQRLEYKFQGLECIFHRMERTFHKLE